MSIRKEVMSAMYQTYVRDRVVNANLQHFQNQSYVALVDFLNYYYHARAGKLQHLKAFNVATTIRQALDLLWNNRCWIGRVVFVIDWGTNEVKGTKSYDYAALKCLREVVVLLGMLPGYEATLDQFDITKHNILLTGGYDAEDVMVYLTHFCNPIFLTNDNDAWILQILLDDKPRLFYKNGRFQVVTRMNLIRTALWAHLHLHQNSQYVIRLPLPVFRPFVELDPHTILD